ncbi:MAG: dephospho-CoA kinase [Desulfobacterales bacterium]|nr:dephospho-CoA kinase [Desulfobacterales bacterium]
MSSEKKTGWDKIIKTMEKIHWEFAGSDGNHADTSPMPYTGPDQLEAIRGKDARLLLGVTGGIAGGKSTVADMLKELGAHLIDYDILARKVVAPGKPAWNEIIYHFGRQILMKDENLDRKKLSRIVFRDTEKRKKLEGIIHPRIHDEFVKNVNEIAAEDPNAIIQTIIPLMIEFNLQYMFHKVLLIYIPREKQVERLIERDRISKEEAVNILKAQLPIDEKIGYADFIIRNENALEETKKQVVALWQELRELQEKSAVSSEREAGLRHSR